MVVQEMALSHPLLAQPGLHSTLRERWMLGTTKMPPLVPIQLEET